MTFRVMSKIVVVVLAVASMGLLSGCEWGKSHGGVAVIDLDAVAQAMGRDKTINEKVQAYAKEREAKLLELKSDLEQRVTEEAKKLDKDASDADKQSLNALVLEARGQLTRELGDARQSAQQMRQQLVRDFAIEMQPLARRAADKRGLTVVLVKQPGMLVVAPEADITNDVIDMSQTTSPAVAPAMPEQQQ